MDKHPAEALLDKPAEAVVDRFGGTRAMADAMGLPPSTIQSWKSVGFIPAQHQQRVWLAARERGIKLTADDIIGITRTEKAA